MANYSAVLLSADIYVGYQKEVNWVNSMHSKNLLITCRECWIYHENCAKPQNAFFYIFQAPNGMIF